MFICFDLLTDAFFELCPEIERAPLFPFFSSFTFCFFHSVSHKLSTMGSNWSYFIDTAKLQGGETLQIENNPKIKNKIPKAADILRDLPKVKHIIVRYCKLTTLPTDLNLLTSLTHLDLEGNDFREFPVQLKSLTNLKTLIIRRNQCDNFPVLVSELKVLTLLDVSDNQIERIPYKLAYGFPELQTLHYARNNLKVFPEAIADLKSLTFLNLSGNKLQDLGSVISQVCILYSNFRFFFYQITYEQIFVTYGQTKMFFFAMISLFFEVANFIFIFFCFFQLTNLQKLVLSHNAFEEVPHIIRRFTKLEHLDLSNNKLTKCEDVLPSLTNLKRLELQHNVLEVVTDEMGTTSYETNHTKIHMQSRDILKILSFVMFSSVPSES